MSEHAFKILLIDDNEADQVLCKHHIKNVLPNAKVSEAYTAAHGIKAIQETAYDCVFLDYHLPDMNGTELLEKIYDPTTKTGPCPIVLLTGAGNESVIIKAIKFGAQDYLSKDNLSPGTLMAAAEKARHVYDITIAQNEIKKKLNHSQKMEALGKLTGGIAHDFNNLLTIILGNTRLLEELTKHDANDPKAEHKMKKLSAIKRAADRGADLVQHLMVFSHQRDLKPSPTNINTTLREMEDLLYRTIGQTVMLYFELSDDLWLTDLDAAQLEHMIINLSANARDAMPDGGDLIVRTQNIIVDDAKAEVINKPPGEYIYLSISDTGIGIAQEFIEKIFDPFFTTKEAGKGTGLGMSIAYGFIKDCGGTINVVSAPNKGTTFEIYFPKSQNQSQHSSTEDYEDLFDEDIPHKKAAFASRTILVAEDELEISDIACDMLERAGSTIYKAENAQDALKILMKHGDEIDVLFTDIIMPGDMNGIQLAIRALDLFPDLKILFTTGFIQRSIPDIHLLDQYTVLDKPYKPDELMTALQDVFND